jgi:hypothetical protein
LSYERATDLGVNAVLVFGWERQHIIEVRNNFQDVKIREEVLIVGGELVGDTQNEFFDLTGGVVRGEGRGKRTIAGILPSTTTFIGIAEQEEGVLEWVYGEKANENGGHTIKKNGHDVILNLGFGDIYILVR